MAEEKKNIPYEIWDFVKKNFLVIVGLIIFFTLYSNGSIDKWTAKGQTIRDTSSVTTQVPQPIIIMPPYQPQQQGSTVFPINIPAQYNASGDIQKLTEQYNELVKQFLAVKTYKDSIELRDTSGLKVGIVDLTQIVAENTLKSIQPTYKLNFPHTTTTITNTVYPKPRTQVFVGTSFESFINTPKVQQIDLGILIKNKKDNIISISGIYDLPLRQPGIRVGYYTKLSFKRIIP